MLLQSQDHTEPIHLLTKPTYHSKRRGRVAPFLGTLATLLILGWLFTGHTNAPSTSKVTTYTVQSGQTIWSIAEQINSNGIYDTRVIEDEIYGLNHLDGQAIQPGEKLTVPVGRS